MKKTSRLILTLFSISALTFAQSAESYSDNNIEYPSFITDVSGDDLYEVSPDAGSEIQTAATVTEGDAEKTAVESTANASTQAESTGVPSESAQTSVENSASEPTQPTDEKEQAVLTSSSGNGLETLEQEDLQTPSRSMSAAQNQYIDVEYPGKGWMYLGETDNTTLLRYFGHTISKDTTFTLRAKAQGTALLHFYKIDPLTGTSINDYLEIVISGKTSSDVHITAPSYGEAVPAGQRKKTDAAAKAESSDENETEAAVESEDEETEEEAPYEEPTADLSAVEAQIEAPKVEVTANGTKKSGQSGSTSSGSQTGSTGANSRQSTTSTSQTGNTGSSSRQSTASGSQNGSSGSASRQSTSTSQSGSTGSSSRQSTTSGSQNGSSGSTSRQSTSTSQSGSTGTSSRQSTTSTSQTGSSGSTSRQSTATGSQTGSSSGTQSGSQSKKGTSASDADGDLLAKAQASFDKGEYAECLEYLTAFFNSAVSRIDEGLYLQGRALEAPSSSRNIKAALDTYETLVKKYPQSKKWNAAKERVVYIKRFYFNIR